MFGWMEITVRRAGVFAETVLNAIYRLTLIADENEKHISTIMATATRISSANRSFFML